jgi:hypothetical protein
MIQRPKRRQSHQEPWPTLHAVDLLQPEGFGEHVLGHVLGVLGTSQNPHRHSEHVFGVLLDNAVPIRQLAFTHAINLISKRCAPIK